MSDNLLNKFYDVFMIECRRCKTKTKQIHHGPLFPEKSRKNNPDLTEYDLNLDIYTCIKCLNSPVYDRRTLKREETAFVYNLERKLLKKKE